MTSAQRSSRYLALWLLPALALVLFCMRGPYRAITLRGTDFPAPYVAGLRFWQHQNPYPPEGVVETWHSRGAPADMPLMFSDASPVYPPPTLVLMAPFSLLAWKPGLLLYTLLSAGAYLALAIRLCLLLPGGLWPPLLATYILAFAPIHTGMGTANLSILSFVLVAHGLLSTLKQPRIAGILVALSLCLKPTIGAPAALLFLLFRCWTPLLWSVGCTGLISAFALFRLHGVSGWYAAYSRNIQYLFGPDGAASYYTPWEGRFDLLNLQVPFYGFTHSFVLANLFAYGIAIGLLAWWGRKYLPTQQMTWGAAASLCLIALLPIYQRNYCAGFVILAVFWAMQQGRQTTQTRLLLLLSLPFLVPGQALLRNSYAHLPMVFANATFRNILFPHLTWAIVGMIVLILAHRDQRGEVSIQS